MTIETANRLVEYRKKQNYSQEEVAEKIGVSRQAVSKWERAEASPDTDNLIALASLYQVSLDELILGKTPEAAPPSDSGRITVTKGDKTVVIEPGMHIHVNDHGADGDEDEDDDEDEEHGGHRFHGEFTLENDPARSEVHRFFRRFPFPVLTAIAYLLFGVFNVCGGWAWGWLVFLLVPIYYSLVESIFLRKADSFAFPVFVTLVYLWCGFEYGWWHPAWVIFLTIPPYYWICESIAKFRKKSKEK